MPLGRQWALAAGCTNGARDVEIRPTGRSRSRGFCPMWSIESLPETPAASSAMPTASTVLVYRPAPGVEIHIKTAPRVVAVQQIMDGSTLDLV
jgi:hypothetical protein